MQTIATSIDDSFDRMRSRLQLEKVRPDHAIDSYFYRSHLVHEQELKYVIFKSWIYALHSSEIPNVGDYQLIEIGEDSVIVVRTADGSIRAMHNICRHRGARVCENPHGNRKTYVCPYHGWVYNLDGSLRAARESQVIPSFDASKYGLKTVKCVTYMGLVFINCDHEAGNLVESLENLRDPLGAYDLGNAKVAHRKTYHVDANWKLAVENYLECYHCATSHRAYARSHTLKDLDEKSAPIVAAMLERADEITGIPGISKQHTQIYLDAPSFGACAHTMRYGLLDGFLTGSEDGQPVAPLMGDIKNYDGGVGDFQLGPLTFMLNYPDHCVLYRFLPRTLMQTDMELVWFVRGDAEEGINYDLSRLTWLWHQTTLEDEFIIGRNSAGVNSRFFEPGPYHPEFEATLQQFIQWYLHTLEQSLG